MCGRLLNFFVADIPRFASAPAWRPASPAAYKHLSANLFLLLSPSEPFAWRLARPDPQATSRARAATRSTAHRIAHRTDSLHRQRNAPKQTAAERSRACSSMRAGQLPWAVERAARRSETMGENRLIHPRAEGAALPESVPVGKEMEGVERVVEEGLARWADNISRPSHAPCCAA